MSTQAVTTKTDILSSVIINGDLSQLNPTQKVEYYQGYCSRLGLDPFTKPFEILKLDNKEILYCTRSGTQQLGKIHEVSHEIVSREIANDCYVVTAKAKTPDGRFTESIGAVPLYKEGGEWKQTAGGKKFFVPDGTIKQYIGDALCNAYMKAETKAKRRATLDLLGLGVLDESEIGNIPGAEIINITSEIVNQPAIQPEQHPSPVQTPFNKKYNDVNVLDTTIKTAVSTDDLKMLYHHNSEIIERNVDLKNAMANKRDLIENQGKTMINDAQYTKLCDRIIKGDSKVFEQAKSTFILNAIRLDELQTLDKERQLLEQALVVKYNNPDDIINIMNSCVTPEQIMKLHTNNAMIIDRTPDLITHFNGRLRVLKNAA